MATLRYSPALRHHVGTCCNCLQERQTAGLSLAVLYMCIEGGWIKYTIDAVIAITLQRLACN